MVRGRVKADFTDLLTSMVFRRDASPWVGHSYRDRLVRVSSRQWSPEPVYFAVTSAFRRTFSLQPSLQLICTNQQNLELI